jgi:S-layer family protein
MRDRRRYLYRLAIILALLGVGGLLLLVGGSEPSMAAPPPPSNFTVTPGPSGTPRPSNTPRPSSTPTRTRTPLPTPLPCGDWRHFPSPNASSQNNHLRGVAVASPNDVWAVGDHSYPGMQPLIEHWDGAAWTVITTTAAGTLEAVAAIAPDDIWAVGYNPGSPGSTLTMHWDGANWETVPSPNVGTSSSYLFGVAAAGPDDVWAVGMGSSQALAIHWDGTAWSVVPTPTYDSAQLQAVTIAGPNDVWAVGRQSTYYPYASLTLHWDGTSWTRVPSPNVGSQRNELSAVTAVAPDDVWAVGWWTDSAIGYNGLILHWDGTQWEVAYGLNQGNSPNTYGVYLEGVSAASANEVWAVGRNYISSSDTLTVILRWDGNAWTQVTNPNPSLTINRLWAVAAVAPGEAWAVGTHYQSAGGYMSLIERYGPGCGTPTPVLPTNTPASGTGTPIPATGTAVLPTGTAAPATETPPVAETGTPVAETSTPTLPTNTTVPATATPIVCSGLTITGSLTLNDPTQPGRLNTLLDASSCQNPRDCPGAIDDIVPRHYDAYTFVNTSTSTACFTVDVEAACLDEILIHSSAYLGTFDPQNLCHNYLADVGPGILIDSQYSFTVPAGTNFVVVVNELAPNLLCPSYTLTVTGPACPVPSTPAPSSTPLPILPTITVPPLPTVEACNVHFSDLTSSNTFYNSVMCLSCMGMMSGYSDGTFRPNNEVTRGQLAKLVSNTAGFNETNLLNRQSFEDVQVGSVFYMYVERVASRGIISGYPCGGPGEACGPDNKPYFRPSANATRGQISKIVSNAARLNGTPSRQTFEDVASSHTFYTWIERLATHGMMGGYACGGVGEPCSTANRPYFRPNANATRGQVSKIVGNGFYPGCNPNIQP